MGPRQYRDLRIETMREVDLLRHIRGLTAHMELLTHHTKGSRDSAPGFPDLVICGPSGLVFWELDTQTGTATPERSRWLSALTEAGATAGLRRPEDWVSGRLHDELQALR